MDNNDHEVCIKKMADDGVVLAIEQVDNLAISGSWPEERNKVRQMMQKQVANELRNLGVIK